MRLVSPKIAKQDYFKDKRKVNTMKSALDPQVRTLLRVLAAAKDNTAPTGDVSALRERIRSYVSLGPPYGIVSSVTNVKLTMANLDIPARLYMARDVDLPSTGCPVLLYFHGGAFVSGDLDSHDSFLRALANRARCAVLSIAYRLAPENRYPAAHEDAVAALKWVIRNGPQLGLDPEACAVGGDSAGGLLAAHTAQYAARRGWRLRLQILLYPTLDLTMTMPSWDELGSGEFLVSRDQLQQCYASYFPQTCDYREPALSPFNASDLSGSAPMLIITADHDPFRDEGDAYAARLKSAGVPVEHTCLPGMIHALASFAGVVDAGTSFLDHIASALRHSLATPEGVSVATSASGNDSDPTSTAHEG